ncbi:hypothetical protein V9T40_013316 [Parthenolecanium corni]|uniref:Glutathione S-transferase n=1 Tax=Parthenolecanium corni TaxID=536013 RepID=A0AAN9TL33_9HEMI
MLKFYYDLASPPVRAVYFTIKHLNIPVEMINVKLFQGELRTKEYLKINPLGRIPVVDDGGIILTDSHAINIYLSTKFEGGDKLYPSDIVRRAIVNQRLFFDTGELFPSLRHLTKKVALKHSTGIDEESLEIFDQGYKGAENYLQNGKFIAGDDLTIADFSVASTIASLNIYVPVNKEKYPLLTAYLERAKKWPHYDTIMEPGIEMSRKFLKIMNFALPE